MRTDDYDIQGEGNNAESFSEKTFRDIGKFGDIGTFGDMGQKLNFLFKNKKI
jgi:hypothetical protein